jgi:hypothetical protein
MKFIRQKDILEFQNISEEARDSLIKQAGKYDAALFWIKLSATTSLIASPLLTEFLPISHQGLSNVLYKIGCMIFIGLPLAIFITYCVYYPRLQAAVTSIKRAEQGAAANP